MKHKFKIGDLAIHIVNEDGDPNNRTATLVRIDDILIEKIRIKTSLKEDGLFGNHTGPFEKVDIIRYVHRHKNSKYVSTYLETELIPLIGITKKVYDGNVWKWPIDNSIS